MTEDPADIRLPGLAVFKRYSLALRQERASAEEILGMLQRSIAQVEKVMVKGEIAPEPAAKKPKPKPRKPPSVVRVSTRGKPIKP
ncbi:MAG: hypothetical protein ABIS18_03240 [Actinomycetota bacterium]